MTDHLGSVRVTVNEQGDPVGWDDYYPFGLQMPGRTQNNSNPNDDQKFTGYELEQQGDLGLYHAGARMYDPVIGRFNSQDRFKEKYPSMSPYQYAALNPITFIDVNGDSLWIEHRGNRYLYEDGNLFNEDGSAYEGRQRGFLGKTAQALDEIREGGTEGEALLAGLQESRFNVDIVSSEKNGYREDPGRAIVKWNSTEWEGGIDETGSTRRNPFIGLAHELGHAQDGVNFTTVRGNWFEMSDGTPITNAEKYGMHIENKIRSEHNTPLRTHYANDSGIWRGPALIGSTKTGFSRISPYFTREITLPHGRKLRTPYAY